MAFLEQHVDVLDEDCKRRMYTNPLRVLDTKNPDVIAILADAPKLKDYFGDETNQHFNGLCNYLDALGIKYTLNDRLVRGLDYYNLTVFEWVTTALGSQGTVCGGGRYDGLVEELGGQATPAIGFAIGLERLILLLQSLNLVEAQPEIDVLVCAMGDEGTKYALQVANQLRQNTEARVLVHCGGGKLKKQLAHADKVNAKFALLIGDDEAQKQEIAIKNLGTGEQVCLKLDETITYFNK